MSSQAVIPLTDVARMQAEGLPWANVSQARWCHRHGKENGFASAFVRIGRRVYVDAAKFHELARAKAERDAQSAA